MKRKTNWLALAEKLEKFSDAIPESGRPKVGAALKTLSARREATPARKKSEPTVADDYPEAWRELQKRRRVMAWGFRLMVLGLAEAGVARVSDHWLNPGHAAIRENSTLQVLVFAPMVMGLFLIFWPTLFRCPRCGERFVTPNSRGAQQRLSSAFSECEHCRLRIGEAPPQ